MQAIKTDVHPRPPILKGLKYSWDCLAAAETNLCIVHTEAKLFSFLFTLSGP